MYFIHHYTQRGFTLDYLRTLKNSEILAYKASMDLAIDEKLEELKFIIKSLSELFPR